MKYLYVCRHGESLANAQGTYAGHLDTPLTDRGRNQARQAGDQARKLHFDIITSSTLGRAVETAQIIAHEVGYTPEDILQNPLFMERNLGSLQGRPFSVPADPAHFPDMESAEALHERGLRALDYLHGLDAECILLVSHGTFLNTLRNIVAGYAADEELPNATIVRLI
ncbi:MAG TPA: histidine phosphatase family protein [Candidatus Saccharimonadales bacterium]|nr:histidine phosphatase family protein [Candidatus Saccharimonadales bacterium]